MFEEIPKNCRYVYARVSSKSQEDNSSLEFQKQEFLRLGVPKSKFKRVIDKFILPSKNFKFRNKFFQLKFEIQRLQFHTYFEKVPDCPNTLCNNYLFLTVDLQNLRSFYQEKEELDLILIDLPLFQ